MPVRKVVGATLEPSDASAAGASPAVMTVAVGSAALTAAFAAFSSEVYAEGLGGFHDHDRFGSFQISHVVMPCGRYRLTSAVMKLANVEVLAGPAAPTAFAALAHPGVYEGNPTIESPCALIL